MELSCQEQNAFTTKRSILKTKPELYRPYGWICLMQFLRRHIRLTECLNGVKKK